MDNGDMKRLEGLILDLEEGLDGRTTDLQDDTGFCAVRSEVAALRDRIRRLEDRF